MDDNHGKWYQYLPEFRFALNSAVRETTGVTPAEIQIGRKLNSPMDKLLKGKILPPDAPAYDVIHQLKQLKSRCGGEYKMIKTKATEELQKKPAILLVSNPNKECGLEISLSHMLRRNSHLSWPKSGKVLIV